MGGWGGGVLGGSLGSSSDPFVLAHCLEAERKPGSPGPESERSPFLLLCDFLFRPAAILHGPGGPVLIRVPACSRAVPEGCVAVQFQSESGRGGERAGVGWGGVGVDPIWKGGGSRGGCGGSIRGERRSI